MSGRNQKRRDEVLAVFAHYRTWHPKAQRNPQPTSKEWTHIEKRLDEGYTVEDLKLAIDGNHHSPFHCGRNPDRRTYHRLELIMRRASNVDDFMEMRDSLGGPVLSEKTARGVEAARAWVGMEGGDE